MGGPETSGTDMSGVEMSGAEIVSRMLVAVALRIEREKDRLCELDAAGDGDHGVSMAIGMRAARRALQSDPPADAAACFTAVAEAFADEVGASVGPLYEESFTALANAFRAPDADVRSAATWSRGFAAVVDAIVAVGGAEPGDKTMLDAWLAARDALADFDGDDAVAALEAASEAAWRSVEETRHLVPKLGRASRLGERARGMRDAGATSASIIIEQLGESLRATGPDGAPR